MRFNYILLLLTALTAVALSQELPCRVKIQSIDPPLPPPIIIPPFGLFLASDSDNNVILNFQGLNWTTVPCARTLCPEGGSSINHVHGESVQFNGLDKELTIAKTREDSSQCWHFQGGGGSVSIISCQNPKAYATAFGLKVKASEELVGGRQLWAFEMQ